jgi:hypothetical protein
LENFVGDSLLQIYRAYGADFENARRKKLASGTPDNFPFRFHFFP